MIGKESKTFLQKILMSAGPSGFETETAKIYRDYLEKDADRIDVDVMGNSIAILNPDAKFKVMFAGHYDEIGFQVVDILDGGLISFRASGGIDKTTLPGTEVEIITKSGKIPGVIGRKPIHLQTPKERETVLEIGDLWIDAGFSSKEEAEKVISVADPAAVAPNCKFLGRSRVMSKGLDDRIGAFVIAEAFRMLAKKKVKIGVYAVGTVQEEVGLRGALASSFGINPNVGIAVDVGFATDVPGLSTAKFGNIKMGAGPMIARTADTNDILFSKIIKTADKAKIPYQLSAGHRASGGTDTAAIQLARGGVATALISIPNRYMHTPVEVCDLEDAMNAAKLIAETVATLKSGDTFRPGID